MQTFISSRNTDGIMVLMPRIMIGGANDWEAISAAAGIVGAIAVVLSLLYLAAQGTMKKSIGLR